jgi:molybdenum cofactor synthesis domain-containing protein
MNAAGTTAPRTAAALIIGNELLTGKVRDENVAVLAKTLFDLGISFERVVICPDVVDVIVADLDALRRRYDYVFTSGGVGPTHDDVTMQAVACAFGQSLAPCSEIEALLHEFFGSRLTPGYLRMAKLPAGATLVRGSRGRWPLVRMENVFILPGLPEVFASKLDVLGEHLAGGTPFVTRAVRTASDEGEIAPLLDRLVREHPAVAIGSYPRWGDGAVQVAVTFDGRDPDAVDRAVAAFRVALPADQIVESEG